MTEERKDRPGVLDNLAFAMLDGKPLISRLAHLYRSQEERVKRDLGRRARDSYEVNDKYVSAWMRPVYTPPYGKVKETVALVVTEVKRQKAIQEERQKVRNYVVTYSKKMTATTYRHSIAPKLYCFEEKEWNRGDYTEKPANCQHLSIFGDYVIALDNRGGYSGAPYLYVLSRKTGKATMGRLKETRINLDGKDISTLLYRLAPPDIRTAAFTGIPVKVDFDALAFYVGEGPTIIPFDFDGDVVITHGFKPLRFRVK